MNETKYIIKEKYQNVLIRALYDVSLSAVEFRVFFYICTSTNKDITTSKMKKDLNIKTSNLMAKSLKSLLEKKYIFRKRVKNKISLNSAFYQYEINLSLDEISLNDNSEKNQFFYDIDEVYNYFFKKLPTSKKIDLPKSKKNIELLIYKDKKNIVDIKRAIDFVSVSHWKKYISRPQHLRANINNILFELINKQN